MSSIYSFTELESELKRLCRELNTAVDDYRKAGGDWARAENKYRKAKAVAFLNAEGTVDARKAQVDVACETERLQAHIAEAEREACKEAVQALRAQLSALQTLVRMNTAEAELTSAPQPRWSINADQRR